MPQANREQTSSRTRDIRRKYVTDAFQLSGRAVLYLFQLSWFQLIRQLDEGHALFWGGEQTTNDAIWNRCSGKAVLTLYVCRAEIIFNDSDTLVFIYILEIPVICGVISSLHEAILDSNSAWTGKC